MVERSKSAKYPIILDEHYLHPYPDASGMQHDECKTSRFPWKEGLREVPNDAPLHPFVIDRFKAGLVVHYDVVENYMPEALKDHKDVKHFYKKSEENDT